MDREEDCRKKIFDFDVDQLEGILKLEVEA
jgi:hypothetical protein